MSRIYKRDNSPYWWYSTGDYPARIRKSTKVKDRKVALRLQEKWDQELALRNAGLEIPTIEIYKPYLLYVDEIMANKKKGWATRIKSALNEFIRINPGITNKHMTAFFMQEYFHKRRIMGRSPKTIKEEHKIIHNWCLWMMAMGYLNDNPMANLIRPTVIQVRPRQAFTRDEVYTAIDNARMDKDKVFWSILYKTGLRSSDACTLENSDLNGSLICKTQTKTGNPVVIPLHKDLRTMDIVNVMHPGAVGRSRERLKEILPQGDLHSFRHSFASHLEEFGATRWDTKCLLGHKANDVTAQYVKINVHRLSKYINQL